MPDYENLQFDRSGPITTITLNRPHKHNALDRALSDELSESKISYFSIYHPAGTFSCGGFMSNRNFLRPRRVALVCAALPIANSFVHAATNTWTGGGGAASTGWSTTTNWSPAAAPTSWQ